MNKQTMVGLAALDPPYAFNKLLAAASASGSGVDACGIMK